MTKNYIFFFSVFISLFIFLTPLVTGLDICNNPISPNIECQIITPMVNCSNYTYKVLNTTGAIIDNNSLSVFGEGLYTFNFSEGVGEYIVVLCDGSTKELIVKNEESQMIALSIIMIMIGGYFIFLGYKNRVWAAKLLGYGVGFLQLILILGIVYASYIGYDFTLLIYIDLMITLLLGFGLGIYTFIMTTVSLVSIEREPGDWGVRWQEK